MPRQDDQPTRTDKRARRLHGCIVHAVVPQIKAPQRQPAPPTRHGAHTGQRPATTHMDSTQHMIAVANAGSSSLKFSLYDWDGTPAGAGLRLRLRGLVEEIGTAPHFVAHDAQGRLLTERGWSDAEGVGHDAALQRVVQYVQQLLPGLRLGAVGHRVVHGGMARTQPVVVTPAILDELDALTPLAPLHEPGNLAPIRLALDLLPGVPQVACFDTAFHRDHTEVEQIFALPYTLYEEGVRRYGFHGLSYEYIAQRLPTVAPQIARGRVIALHLGNGASMCALQDGRSVASTMGFTALDGLPMGTRCGTIDAGVVLYLLQQRGMTARQVQDMLYKQSGLLGLSGVASDMRALLASDAPRARLAVDVFVHRIVREVGSLAAALGGLDALVFTAGIGERAAEVRARVLAGLDWMGFAPDAARNAAHGPCITTEGSARSAWVVPTDEELMIARHCVSLLHTPIP